MTPADLDMAAFREQAYRIAMAILADPDLAADAAQDAVERALKRVGDVREDKRINAWLVTVSKRVALGHRRTRARWQGRSSDVDPDITAAEARDEPDPKLRAFVRRTLAQLSPHERESLLLVHLDGWTYEQLSRYRGQTLSAAKMQASRAREKFRHLFPSDLAPGAE